MKPVKLSLRIWIAVTSILSFLGGWALLSHAGKPAALFPAAVDLAAPAVSNSVPTLAPIPSLDSLTASAAGTSTTLQTLPSQPNVSRTVPRLRSRGS